MALFQFRWLRKFIRRHSNPIPEQRAEDWKKRLSLGYAFLAWNAFGFVCYMVYTGRADWAETHGLKTEAEKALTPAQQWTRTLGIKDATVYRIKGTAISKYEIHNETADTKNNSGNNDNSQTNVSDENISKIKHE